jgi:glycosyltransferase involved in cell wall biosynthesis
MPNKALIYNPFWDTFGGGERYTATFAKMLLDHGWSLDILWPENISSQIKNRFGLDLSQAKWLPEKFSPFSTINYQLVFWLSDGSIPISLAGKTIIHLQFPFTGIGGHAPVNYLKSRFYKFVVNSGFTKSYIDREFHIQSQILYPPVDVKAFVPGKKAHQILYVGRFSNLTQRKGQEILIRAFSGISNKMPGWKLILTGGTAVGTGRNDLIKLRRQIGKLPVEIITDPDLPTLKKLYAQSQIFWSASGFGVDADSDPTHVEHFGITVVEAMSAGCTPVITRLGGHKEIVTQGVDGFLFDKLSELSDYTLHLVSSRDLWQQISQAAVAKSKMFSVERFNEKALALVSSGSDT